MKDDPAIQAIRDARHAISAECGHDPKRLGEYYRKRHAEYVARRKQAEKEKLKQEKETAA